MQTTVGIAQFLATPADAAGNLVRAVDHVASLASRGCDLIVLPELWPCGFSWDTLADDAAGGGRAADGPRGGALSRAAQAAGAWVLAGTVPELDGGDLFNTAVLYGPTAASPRCIARCGCTRRWARIAPSRRATSDRRPPSRHRAGRHRDVLRRRLPRGGARLRRAGARVVLHPAAYEVAAERWWDVLYPANALANGQWWIGVNQCGATPSGTLLGASRVISPAGEIVAEATRVPEGGGAPAEELVVTLDIASEVARWDETSTALVAEARVAPPVRVIHVA